MAFGEVKKNFNVKLQEKDSWTGVWIKCKLNTSPDFGNKIWDAPEINKICDSLQYWKNLRKEL